MRRQLTRFQEQLEHQLWFAPVLGLVVAALLSALMLEIDDSVSVGGTLIVGFDGGPESARSILSTIAGAMLTFLALVFSLTIVALQLASDYSPRLLRTFLTRRVSATVFALFVATFTYSVLVLREAGPTIEDVPELSVTVAIVMVLFSVIAFVYFLSDIAQSLRVADILERAGDATRAELRRLPTDGEPGDEQKLRELGWDSIGAADPSVTWHWRGRPGVITSIELSEMRARARQEDAVLALRVGVGDFVPTGAPVVDVFRRGEKNGDGGREIESLVKVGSERTFYQDPAFGLRQLVDIAAKALSPGVNDPTTAVQAIDQIHDILIRVGNARLRSGVLRDDEGQVRILIPVRSWSDYVHLGVDEIRLYSEGSMQVVRRIGAMLDDLSARLPECRQAAVERQRELLRRGIANSFPFEQDRERASARHVSAAGSEGGG